MKKIEITDEMVDRAIARAYRRATEATRFDAVNDSILRNTFRGYLEAALNPLPEPEIEVTEEMVDEGYRRAQEAMQAPGIHYGPTHPVILRVIYRAMRKLEPLPAYPGIGDSTYCHWGDDDSLVFARGRRRRRKDDPK